MIQYVAKNKYKITVECGIVNNKRKRISRNFKGTKQEAKIFEAKLITQVKNGTINIKKADKEEVIESIKINNNEKNRVEEKKKLTFKELADKFINDYCINNLKENTIYGYKSLLKVILLELGDYEAEAITPYILQLYYNKLKNEYLYSSNTILHHYVLINNIFVRGIKWQLITSNPNSFIDRPKLHKEEPKIYDYDDLGILLKAIETEPINYRTPIILCVDSGMRREELNGLLWSDINFETHEININKVRIAVGDEIIVTTPKTAKSKRTIIVSEISINLLKKLKEYQVNLANSLGNKWNDTGYVFVNDIGLPYYPDTLSKIFKNIQKRHNLDKITFHGLRHTSISLLINSNEDITSVSVRAGHSNVSTTLNMYSHVIEKSKREAANTMNKILSNA